LIAALAAAAALLSGYALFVRAGGAPLRILALAVLLLALANPSLVTETHQPLDDIVLLVSDETPSQEIGARAAQRDRALNGLTEAIEALDNTELHTIHVGDRNLDSAASGTRLFADIEKSLATLPRDRVAGILLLSDGQIHDVPESFEALGLQAPLHLLLTGERTEGDRRLTIGRAPSFGIVGAPLTLAFTVEDLRAADGAADDGAADNNGKPVEVTLRQGGQVVEKLLVPVGVEQEVEIQLDHRGATLVEIEAAAAEKELSLVNNRAAIVINGVRDRLRVLLISGEPHAGERAWRNILKSDPAVDLVHFTILRPPEKQDGTPIHELSLIAFPTRELFELKLDEFDLVIFDRYRRRGVLPSIYLDNIARYVDGGGALLEAVGPTFASPLSIFRTPVGRVLPGEPTGTVFDQGFKPRVTGIGLRHPVTHGLKGNEDPENPAWGRWFRQVGVTPRNGNVVMSGVENEPLLILARVGEGRVAQILSDQMWLWSRGFEGGGPQTELLRRIAHWLMKEPDLEEEDLVARVDGGELLVERRSLSSELPEIDVTLPSGQTRRLSLAPGDDGIERASLPIQELGIYRVGDGSRTALAAAGPLNPLEYADLRSSGEALAPLIAASGGSVLRLADLAQPDIRKLGSSRDLGGRDWVGLKAQGRYLVTGIAQTALLPALLVLLAAIGAAVAAWYREGH
jgi:hypothetical protein